MMYSNFDETVNVSICNQNIERYLNPADINIAFGYTIEVFAEGLDTPISLLFNENGDMIVAESGLASGRARVLQLVGNQFVTISEGFRVPISGVNYIDGLLYISHRGFITRVDRQGVKQDIITGLPSNGDFYNSRVVFGTNNKLYFGQGTATNSGVVGPDNNWVSIDPLTCDYPGDYILLYGQNFFTTNITNEFAPGELVSTGAFSPYGIANAPFELRKKYMKASGSILRANLDGTDLELYAWGLRNPAYLNFDIDNRLFVANQGYDNRGSRPIANAPDELQVILPDTWYGWPDYAGGLPVTLPQFKPDGGRQPEFLIKNHPNIPPLPYTTFPSGANIIGFDFNYYESFGPYGDVYIAEYGSDEPMNIRSGVGHRISRVDMKTGAVSTFAINKSGFPSSISNEGGFNRPVSLAFGPDGAMYILDIGLSDPDDPRKIVPNTGVIWRVYRSSK